MGRANQRAEEERTAYAPYNFVQLPEKILDVRSQDGCSDLDQALPSHDRFEATRNTGFFEVTLTTRSPLYVRGMNDLNEFASDRKDKPDFFGLSQEALRIPGSSLRGMIRSAIEVITWSKLQFTDRLLMYRGIGDTTTAGEHYRKQFLGNNLSPSQGFEFTYPAYTIRGGYLEQTPNCWGIRPAQVDPTTRDTFTFISKGDAQRALPHLQTNNHYSVQVIPSPRAVYYSQSRHNLSLRISQGHIGVGAGSRAANLIVSAAVAGRRHWYPAIFAPDTSANPIQISPEKWEAYELDRDAKRGIPNRRLVPGAPLFYMVDSKGDLVFFGPTLMFRMPYQKRLSDVLPGFKDYDQIVDFAESLFGYVRSGKMIAKQGDKKRAYAGRVFVTDAEILPHQENVLENVITPPILSTPKPTTFQHYLWQTEGAPRGRLIHYDTSGAKLRGVKYYWRKRLNSTAALHISQDQMNNEEQYTTFQAVRTGVTFRFRVYFENLTEVELGAIAWVMAIAEKETYCHALGMGKPFGMGSVGLEAKLHISRRNQRYEALFEEWAGNPNQTSKDLLTYRSAFEAFMNAQLSPAKFNEHERIQSLMALMKQRDPHESLEYMVIEPNQFKNRPVLPYAITIGKELDRIERERHTARTTAAKPSSVPVADEVVRGKVVDVDDRGGAIFAINNYPDKVEGYLPSSNNYSPGQQITAIVLKVEDKGDGIFIVYCRRATSEEKKRKN